ncbi:MAG: hypothetical protein OXC95_02600, partial [Dehalococcoidia bacterium]|nr:hypothetical protein [Dehalococcoidia bacterium]
IDPGALTTGQPRHIPMSSFQQRYRTVRIDSDPFPDRDAALAAKGPITTDLLSPGDAVYPLNETQEIVVRNTRVSEALDGQQVGISSTPFIEQLYGSTQIDNMFLGPGQMYERFLPAASRGQSGAGQGLYIMRRSDEAAAVERSAGAGFSSYDDLYGDLIEIKQNYTSVGEVAPTQELISYSGYSNPRYRGTDPYNPSGEPSYRDAMRDLPPDTQAVQRISALEQNPEIPVLVRGDPVTMGEAWRLRGEAIRANIRDIFHPGDIVTIRDRSPDIESAVRQVDDDASAALRRVEDGDVGDAGRQLDDMGAERRAIDADTETLGRGAAGVRLAENSLQDALSGTRLGESQSERARSAESLARADRRRGSAESSDSESSYGRRGDSRDDDQRRGAESGPRREGIKSDPETRTQAPPPEDTRRRGSTSDDDARRAPPTGTTESPPGTTTEAPPGTTTEAPPVTTDEPPFTTTQPPIRPPDTPEFRLPNG